MLIQSAAEDDEYYIEKNRIGATVCRCICRHSGGVRPVTFSRHLCGDDERHRANQNRRGDGGERQSYRYDGNERSEQSRQASRLSPDERRALRRQIDEAGRDIYAPRR